MSTPKIRLSIVLPGSTLFSQEETCKLQDNELVPDKSKFNHFQIQVMEKTTPVTLKVSTRKCRPASQVISLTEDAYEEFIGPSAPYKYKGVWKNLSKNQKVQWHCEQIAEALGGKLDSFVILD